MQTQQLLTYVLVGACALLGVAAGVQMTGLGAGYSLHPERGQDGTGVSDAELAALGFELPSFQRYVEMQNRPLFNDDRRPTPVIEEAPPEVVDKGTPVSPVDVTLTGIIITETSRLAIVQDNKSKSALVLREGMPLKGDQAAWVLRKVEPRKVTFDGGGEPTEISLALNTKAMQAPTRPAPARAAPAAAPAEGNTEPGDPQATAQTRAEEIRRKIEERRRQMREEAQRANATANAKNKGA